MLWGFFIIKKVIFPFSLRMALLLYITITINISKRFAIFGCCFARLSIKVDRAASK